MDPRGDYNKKLSEFWATNRVFFSIFTGLVTITILAAAIVNWEDFKKISLGDAGVILFLFGIIVIPIGLIEYRKQRRLAEIKAAKNAYNEALLQLKMKPFDPDLKQRALYLGRVYANLTRNKRGVAIFDEVALMNDINAACASAINQTALAQPANTLSVEARLEQLSKLKEKGLINSHEYDERKQRILDEI